MNEKQKGIQNTLSDGALSDINSDMNMTEDERLRKGYKKIAEGIDKEAEETKTERPIVELVSYIRRCWDAAKKAKENAHIDLYKSALQRQGKYTQVKEKELIAQGEEPVFVNLTSTKCRAAESYFIDVLSSEEPIFTVKPTPIPELPSERMEYIKNYVMGRAQANQLLTQVKDQQEMTEYIADGLLQKMRDDAQVIAGRMGTKIEDQLIDGGWRESLREVIPDIVTYKAGFLKGPIVRKIKKLEWSNDGDWTPQQVDALIIEYDRVDPFDIYPSPSSSSIDDGYIVQKHSLTRRNLIEMIGVEGYDDTSIMSVLQNFGESGYREWAWTEEEKKEREAKGKEYDHTISNPDETIDAIEFWGSIQGKMLIEWGMKESEIPDPIDEYPANVWMINDYVIKATLNPSVTGKKPYYKASYDEIPGSFWGRGVPELMSDIQDICNACVRAIVRNAGVASGPQAIIDRSMLEEGTDIDNIYPFKIWVYNSDPMVASSANRTGRAIDFFQPNPIVDVLMAVFNQFEQRAEEVTGIPKYVYGSTDIHGAGRTASGLSMLMSNAAKGIKSVLASIDSHIIEPSIYELYVFNMMFDTNPLIKGDLKIVARGVESLLQREQTQIRLIEAMNMLSQNPVYMQIVGTEGIAKLLRKVFKSLNITDVIPSEEEIKIKEMERQQQQMQMMQQQQAMGMMAGKQPPMEAPRNLDIAGNPAQGTDTAMYLGVNK